MLSCGCHGRAKQRNKMVGLVRMYSGSVWKREGVHSAVRNRSPLPYSVGRPVRLRPGSAAILSDSMASSDPPCPPLLNCIPPASKYEAGFQLSSAGACVSCLLAQESRPEITNSIIISMLSTPLFIHFMNSGRRSQVFRTNLFA